MEDFLVIIIFSVIAGGSTGIGGIIGIFKRLSMKYFDMITGFAAGVMLAVATFGLIDEGIIILNEGTPFAIIAIVIVSGVGLGMILLLVLDKVLPHLHVLDNSQDRGEQCVDIVSSHDCKWSDKEKWFECPYFKDEKCQLNMNLRCPRELEFQMKAKNSGILLASGLTIHNAPEGIAMGVGFLAAPTLGFTMTIAIALHNIPEGLAIAVPLIQGKYPRQKIIFITLLSGMAEPLACVIAIFLLQNISLLFLAFFLAFAGGAMIYITSDELIPESHKHGYEHEATVGLLLGLILMLILTIIFQI
ncbi:MAG: ZIP family metal transporter [Promethearchaeota archaeon]